MRFINSRVELLTSNSQVIHRFIHKQFSGKINHIRKMVKVIHNTYYYDWFFLGVLLKDNTLVLRGFNLWLV